MDVFAAAKRQYRLQLRPDEVLAEASWADSLPTIEEVNSALAQLAEWGNLDSQPDTARVSSLSDFYRARFLYRLSHGGEAVETSLAVFFQTLQRRAELQTVALEDIASRLQALQQLMDHDGTKDGLDVAKAHQVLRDLVGVFNDLAENAQAFMAGVARSRSPLRFHFPTHPGSGATRRCRLSPNRGAGSAGQRSRWRGKSNQRKNAPLASVG